MRDLPDYFTNVTRAKSGNGVTMTTLHLVSVPSSCFDPSVRDC